MMRVTALLLCSWSCAALTLQTEANPIRKIVTLLQDMQKEITAEGEKEKKLYDKFMSAPAVLMDLNHVLLSNHCHYSYAI